MPSDGLTTATSKSNKSDAHCRCHSLVDQHKIPNSPTSIRSGSGIIVTRAGTSIGDDSDGVRCNLIELPESILSEVLFPSLSMRSLLSISSACRALYLASLRPFRVMFHTASAEQLPGRRRRPALQSALLLADVNSDTDSDEDAPCLCQ